MDYKYFTPLSTIFLLYYGCRIHWYPLEKPNRFGARHKDGKKERRLELGTVTCRSVQIRRGVSSDHRDMS